MDKIRYSLVILCLRVWSSYMLSYLRVWRIHKRRLKETQLLQVINEDVEWSHLQLSNHLGITLEQVDVRLSRLEAEDYIESVVRYVAGKPLTYVRLSIKGLRRVRGTTPRSS